MGEWDTLGLFSLFPVFQFTMMDADMGNFRALYTSYLTYTVES